MSAFFVFLSLFLRKNRLNFIILTGYFCLISSFIYLYFLSGFDGILSDLGGGIVFLISSIILLSIPNLPDKIDLRFLNSGLYLAIFFNTFINIRLLTNGFFYGGSFFPLEQLPKLSRNLNDNLILYNDYTLIGLSFFVTAFLLFSIFKLDNIIKFFYFLITFITVAILGSTLITALFIFLILSFFIRKISQSNSLIYRSLSILVIPILIISFNSFEIRSLRLPNFAYRTEISTCIFESKFYSLSNWIFGFYDRSVELCGNSFPHNFLGALGYYGLVLSIPYLISIILLFRLYIKNFQSILFFPLLEIFFCFLALSLFSAKIYYPIFFLSVLCICLQIKKVKSEKKVLSNL